MSDDGLFGSLSLVGLISLCCLGFGGLVGAAAVTGGAASGGAVAIGGTDARGALVSGVVTFGTVLVIATVFKLRAHRS